MVYQLVEMSVTAANLIDDIRVDKATQKGSVHDVIKLVSKEPLSIPHKVLLDLWHNTQRSTQNV